MVKRTYGTELISEQQQVEAPGSQLVLPYQFIGNLTPGSITPSVKNITRCKCINTAPVSVSYFNQGQEGQEIKILGDGFTTLVYDITKIITNTAADKLLDLNSVFTFTKFDNLWIEESCCSGGSSGEGIDGGTPDSVFGGTSPIEGGGP